MSIAAYLEVAKTNLLAGKKAGIIPDRRMVQRDGIDGSKANSDYFRTTLPKTSQQFLGTRPFAATMQAQILGAGAAAANAWDQFGAFMSQTYDVNEPVDRYAAGEVEYEWRVHNVLRDPRTAAELYEYGATQVAFYTSKIVDVAKEFSQTAKLGLPFGTDADNYASVKKVMDFLSKDSPKNDAQLFKWYRDAGTRAVAYGREHNLFDIPATYRLDVIETPPVLRSAIDAAYYPAPPFKKTGVGRFYLTPTGNDPDALKLNNFSSVADTAVHEGFPGHDWHFKYMTEHSARHLEHPLAHPGSGRGLVGHVERLDGDRRLGTVQRGADGRSRFQTTSTASTRRGNICTSSRDNFCALCAFASTSGCIPVE